MAALVRSVKFYCFINGLLLQFAWLPAPWAGDAVGFGYFPNGDLTDAEFVSDGGIGHSGRGKDFIPHSLVESRTCVIHELL